jgi:AcrR family transcriptional regulator
MTTTRAERAASTRHKLLDAAVEQFLDKPYDEVSVHDLAHAAGVAYGLVAHHYGNKRGIYLEAMREIARRFAPVPPPPGPAAVRIRHLVHTLLADIERHPVAYLGLMLGTDSDSRAIYEDSRRLAMRIFGEILDLDPDRPAVRLAMRSWIAALGEAAVVWLEDGCLFPADDLIEFMLATQAELLRQAARLDPALDLASALSALDRPDGSTAAPVPSGRGAADAR